MTWKSPLTYDQQRVLMGRLNPDRVAHRDQGGRSLSYVEAWDIRATLIRVFGYGGFDIDVIDYSVMDVREVPKTSGNGVNQRVTATARVRLTIHQLDCTYTEAAASTQTNPDLGEAMDFAIKTAASDALKRCASNLGTQFGLSLYDNGSRSDVVRVVFSPGQEWPRDAEQSSGGPSEPEPTMEEAEARIAAAFSAGAPAQPQETPGEEQA